MYELYIGNKNYSSWSLRPWVLMRAQSIPFNERLMQFAPGSNWSAFRKFSPNGRVPSLHDGKTVVWDSLAIIEYLAERHPAVWPVDATMRAWARSAASEMHSGFSELRNRCSMSCGLRVKLNEIGTGLRADITRIDELWKEGLVRFAGPYLAGARFSAVDAFFAPVVFRVQTYGLPLSKTASTYAELMLAEPAMREWYDAGIAETYREPGHEAEVAEAGTVTADLRAKPN
jgi:glutathione S-transferase